MPDDWTNLGEYSPDHYDPTAFDPFEMNDLKDPSQAVGPVGPPQSRGDPARGPVPTNGNQAPQRFTPGPPNPANWDVPDVGPDDGAFFLGTRAGLGDLPDLPEQPGRGDPGYGGWLSQQVDPTAKQGAWTGGSGWAGKVPWEEIGKTISSAGDVYVQQRQLETLNRLRAQQGLQPVTRLPVSPAPRVTYGMNPTTVALIALGAVAFVGIGFWLWQRRR